MFSSEKKKKTKPKTFKKVEKKLIILKLLPYI